MLEGRARSEMNQGSRIRHSFPVCRTAQTIGFYSSIIVISRPLIKSMQLLRLVYPPPPDLLAKRAHLSPPPVREVHRRDIDPQILEGLGAEMAIIWSLHTCIGIIAFSVRRDARRRHAHDLSEALANLILSHLVLTGELQDPRESLSIICLKVLVRHIFRRKSQPCGWRVLGVRQGGLRHTMADAGDVLCVCGIPQRPVIHRHLGSLRLRLPERVHEDIDSALCRCLGLSVQHGDSQDHSGAVFPCRLIFLEHSSLAIQLRLAVEIWGLGSGIHLVGGVSRRAREDVVCGDVDEEDALGSRQPGERLASRDVQSSRALWVLVDLVREPLRSA